MRAPHGASCLFGPLRLGALLRDEGNDRSIALGCNRAYVAVAMYVCRRSRCARRMPSMSRPRFGALLGVAWGAVASSCGSTPPGDRVDLPGAAPGIGFDDLRYSSALHRVLVPAGRSGRLDLIDPDRLTVTEVGGFGATPDFGGGHDDGPTSV